MNFIFESGEQTSEILNLPRDHKMFSSPCNVLLLHRLMTAFLTIFRSFPKILQHLSVVHTNVAKHFPKITEDYQRLSKFAEDFRGRPEDVSITYQETNLTAV